jgi:hypothetical protein
VFQPNPMRAADGGWEVKGTVETTLCSSLGGGKMWGRKIDNGGDPTLLL